MGTDSGLLYPSSVGVGDGVVVVAFALAICWLVWSARWKRSGGTGAMGYLLANQDVSWLPLSMTMVSTVLSAGSVAGMLRGGAEVGLASAFELWVAPAAVLLLAFVVAPLWRRARVLTLAEYFGRRYDGRVRVYMALVSTLFAIFGRIAAAVIATEPLLRAFDGLNAWAVAVLLVPLSTGLSLGGMRAMVSMQSVFGGLLVAGGLVLLVSCMIVMRGWPRFDLVVRSGSEAVKAGLRGSFLELSGGTGAYDWTNILFGAPMLAFWTVCCEGTMVQRVVAARSAGDVRGAAIVAAALLLLMPFCWAATGVVARLLFPHELGCGDAGCADPGGALFFLVQRVVPSLAKGVVLAAAAGSVVATIASSLHTAASMMVLDVLAMTRGGRGVVSAAAHNDGWYVVRAMYSLQVGIGLSALVFVVAGAYLGAVSGEWLLNASAVVAAPVVVVLVIGARTRVSATGALASLAVGHFLGVVRLVADQATVESLADGVPILASPMGSLAVISIVSASALLMVSAVTTEAAAEAIAPYQLRGLNTCDGLPCAACCSCCGCCDGSTPGESDQWYVNARGQACAGVDPAVEEDAARPGSSVQLVGTGGAYAEGSATGGYATGEDGEGGADGFGIDEADVSALLDSYATGDGDGDDGGGKHEDDESDGGGARGSDGDEGKATSNNKTPRPHANGGSPSAAGGVFLADALASRSTIGKSSVAGTTPASVMAAGGGHAGKGVAGLGRAHTLVALLQPYDGGDAPNMLSHMAAAVVALATFVTVLSFW